MIDTNQKLVDKIHDRLRKYNMILPCQLRHNHVSAGFQTMDGTKKVDFAQPSYSTKVVDSVNETTEDGIMLNFGGPAGQEQIIKVANDLEGFSAFIDRIELMWHHIKFVELENKKSK